MHRIEEILLEAKVLEKSQIESALSQRKDSQEGLGSVLVRLGLLTEELLVKTLARKMRLPVLDLASLEIPEHVLVLLPKEFLEKHCLLPVALKGIAGKQNLIVAMADPTNGVVVENLKNRIPYALRLGIASESNIRQAQQRYKDLLRGEEDWKTPEGAVSSGERSSPKIPVAGRKESEPDENTESVSLKLEPVVEQDGEITQLTKQEGPLDSDDAKILNDLTEPTHSKFRLPEPTVDSTALDGSVTSASSEGVSKEISRFVQRAQKDILLESIIQLLIDRGFITLEELMTTVELKK